MYMKDYDISRDSDTFKIPVQDPSKLFVIRLGFLERRCRSVVVFVTSKRSRDSSPASLKATCHTFRVFKKGVCHPVDVMIPSRDPESQAQHPSKVSPG
jgi:hypothetical protein